MAGLPDSANQFWALIPVEVWVGGFGGDEGRGPSVRGTGKGAGFLKNLGVRKYVRFPLQILYENGIFHAGVAENVFCGLGRTTETRSLLANLPPKRQML